MGLYVLLDSLRIPLNVHATSSRKCILESCVFALLLLSIQISLHLEKFFLHSNKLLRSFNLLLVESTRVIHVSNHSRIQELGDIANFSINSSNTRRNHSSGTFLSCNQSLCRRFMRSSYNFNSAYDRFALSIGSSPNSLIKAIGKHLSRCNSFTRTGRGAFAVIRRDSKTEIRFHVIHSHDLIRVITIMVELTRLQIILHILQTCSNSHKGLIFCNGLVSLFHRLAIVSSASIYFFKYIIIGIGKIFDAFNIFRNAVNSGKC